MKNQDVEEEWKEEKMLRNSQMFVHEKYAVTFLSTSGTSTLFFGLALFIFP